jgi:hypothetical protein
MLIVSNILILLGKNHCDTKQTHKKEGKSEACKFE